MSTGDQCSHNKLATLVPQCLGIEPYQNQNQNSNLFSSLYTVSVLPSVRSIARPSGVQVSVPRITIYFKRLDQNLMFDVFRKLVPHTNLAHMNRSNSFLNSISTLLDRIAHARRLVRSAKLEITKPSTLRQASAPTSKLTVFFISNFVLRPDLLACAVVMQTCAILSKRVLISQKQNIEA